MKRGLRVIVISLCIFSASIACAQTIEERFNGKKLSYAVYYNAIPVGSLEWEYKGRGVCGLKATEVIAFHSNTKILKFINIIGDERVHLDCETFLPLKVERDIVWFGKKEIIEEFYNQDKGYVMIVNSRAQAPEIFRQEKPIHHILALLYFFPEGLELEKGESRTFNLPTRKLTIKMVSERVLSTKEGKKDTYFLVGRGAKRFNLWLDKEERTPLRLEFIVPLGKISIVKRKHQ